MQNGRIPKEEEEDDQFIVVVVVVVVTGNNAAIALTHGAISRFFASHGRHFPPIIAKFGIAVRYVLSNFTYIGSYLRMSDPKTQKSCIFYKLICPVGANPTTNIHEIYHFRAPIWSAKTFQI